MQCGFENSIALQALEFMTFETGPFAESPFRSGHANHGRRALLPHSTDTQDAPASVCSSCHMIFFANAAVSATSISAFLGLTDGAFRVRRSIQCPWRLGLVLAPEWYLRS